MGNLSSYIKDIMNELKRWESIPKRRESVTKEMILYIVNKRENLNKVNQDDIYTALGDWLILGQQTGFRRKEWAQDRTHL